MHFDTKKLTRCALIAAIYVALTMLSNALNLAYGPIQLRFSEAMTVLPFLMPEASWGLFIGCVLSNILSPYGPLDMIVGSAATLLAALLTARCRNKWTAALPPVLCNAILIGALIAWEEAGVGNGFPPAFDSIHVDFVFVSIQPVYVLNVSGLNAPTKRHRLAE